MKVLFMNRNTGAGVEFEGNIFIDILKRIVGIDSIDIYKTQCRKEKENFDFSKYDLLILNDISFNNRDDYKFNIPSVPIININFGGVGNRSEEIDIVMDINIPYTMYNEKDMWNYYQINFISGNIWESKTKWEDRSDDILYIGRLVEQKIIPKFLDCMRSVGKKIDFYGIITSQDYYEKFKDVINYKGLLNHKDLLDVYNNYKSLYLFSTTECLSMTIREAILCETVPIIYDDKTNYSKAVNDYIIKCDRTFFYNPKIENKDIINKHKSIVEDYHYIQNYLNFDKMIIDFIFCLRGLLLKDFKFNKNYRSKIKVLHNERENDSKIYVNDTIDWDKVKI